jgi:hypothetical protein
MKLFTVVGKLTAPVVLIGALALSPGAGPEPARSAEVPAADEGVDVLARGPVHEAFARPTTLQAKPSPIVPKQPPPPIQEAPPDMKPDGNNVQWIGGYWSWDDDKSDFIWVSGFWRDIPPGRQWVPGYWTRLADGWQWVSGYWAEAGQNQSDFLPAPPPTLENGPSALPPGDDYSYVPGSWIWRDRYIWRPGYWLNCNPDWVWTPVDPRLLQLVASRLHLLPRLLGLPAGPPRSAVRAGLLPPAVLEPVPQLVLAAEILRQQPLPVQPPLRSEPFQSFLLRRLRRSTVCEQGFHSLFRPPAERRHR